MSLSEPTWNHFGSHHPFPVKQDFANFYPDALSPSILPPLYLSAFPQTSSINMNALSADEMERFQKLSNTYRPETEVAVTHPLLPVASNIVTGSPCLNKTAQPQYRSGLF
jgi:ubiquitin thioesterase protein OTUB1